MLSALVLGACADIDLPSWASGEPPIAQGTNLRPDYVRRDPEHAAWPNLATVPPKPTQITPPAQRQQTMREMMSESRLAPPPVDIAPVRP